MWWRTSISWPVQFTCEGYLYIFVCLEELPEVAKTWISQKNFARNEFRPFQLTLEPSLQISILASWALIWSVNTMQKGFRPGFNQVTETIYWKSWVLKDVSNRITSFAVPRTCKNSSKTVSKARLSSQMHCSRQTIFHGLKKVKKSHAGVHWHKRDNPGLAL